jgi:3-dehydroquinate dehydratase/shikimate dehydrogenase
VSSGPRVCISLGVESREHLIGWKTSGGLGDADLVEVRLDCLDPAVTPDEVAELLDGFAVPVMATCRRGAEGGAWRLDEAARVEVLRACAATGVAYLDIELATAALPEFLEHCRDRVVASHHWATMPDGRAIDAVIGRLRGLRPAMVKLVVPVEVVDGAVRLLPAAAALRAEGIRTAIFPQGEASAAGRLVAAAQGDAWIYARLPGEPGTAAGQWRAALLRHELKVARWRSEYARFSVVGHPVRQSLSPTVFNAAFAAAGAAALYMPLPGHHLGAVLRLAAAGGVGGLSVTMPFKVDALAVSTHATSQARRAGAANTLRRVDGGWEAHNTDGEGLVAALRARGRVRGSRVAILGAGGAARAAAVALQDAGAAPTYLVRDLERAARTAADTGVPCRLLTDYANGDADIIINATPVGMHSTAETPIPTARLNGGEVVLDMIYRPAMTSFLAAATARGCTTVSGLEMFLEQAAAQYRWWLDEAPPDGVMDRAARAQIETEERSA